MPTYHRIISVPAEQIRKGDVVIVHKNTPYNWSSFFSNVGLTEIYRYEVVNWHRDPADGTIYIQAENHAEYVDAHAHIKLDCLLTFGRNGGEVK